MKVLHIISSLNPSFGGPVEGLKQLAMAAKGQGHVIEIVAMDTPDSPWLVDFGIKVHPLGPSYLTYAYAPGFVPWLRKHAAEYDVVIIHGLWQFLGYAARKILLEKNIPYFVFTHGQLGTWFKKAYPFKQVKKWLYWQLVEYRILRDAKSVLFTSDDEKLQSRKSFRPYKVSEAVVGYGTVIPEGDPEQQKELFHTHFPGLRDKSLLVFVGRLAQQKACDLLLQAFAEIAQGDSSLHLIMAGPDLDGWKQELVAISEQLGISCRVTWTGMLTGDVKWGAFHAAECFILPSHHESFGVVVAEALACGLPVLISNKVNIWHEVYTADAGFVSNDDLQGTVGILKQWVALPCHEKEIMRKKALDCFSNYFDINSTIIKMTQVLSSADSDK